MNFLTPQVETYSALCKHSAYVWTNETYNVADVNRFTDNRSYLKFTAAVAQLKTNNIFLSNLRASLMIIAQSVSHDALRSCVFYR